MKKSKIVKIVSPMLVGILVLTAAGNVQAVGPSIDDVGDVKLSILAPELLPVVTTNEANEGLSLEGQPLPDEFLVKSTSNPMLRSASLGYEKWTKVSSTKKMTNGKLGWHPGWSHYQYNISAYYFSSSNYSVSFNLGYGAISASVSRAGGGQIVKANPKKWTRPAVYGNVNRIKWNVKKYNGSGVYTGSTTKYTNTSSGVYVKSVNK
ncbi:hypothetical protein MFLO_02713 [Listeria floridensis FSL S10-1187]|uniref:DUF5626 domain-containing protein n=1 Tax=Listeria floridensis FSL S10-1187 TaxID=1265817 RepID=A0ABN0RHL0_9LIST|nr:hypothetical protein [Listeria floridensis]EUJ33427.1 hypothetical protein MFLO_02713 [Listeria floridensis FSL S10-1187]